MCFTDSRCDSVALIAPSIRDNKPESRGGGQIHADVHAEERRARGQRRKLDGLGAHAERVARPDVSMMAVTQIDNQKLDAETVFSTFS